MRHTFSWRRNDFQFVVDVRHYATCFHFSRLTTSEIATWLTPYRSASIC